MPMPESLPAVLLPAAAFALAALAGLLGAGWPRRAGAIALGASLLTALAFVVLLVTGTDPTASPWIPDWNVSLLWRLDGLAIAYGSLTLAVALAVFAYAPAYMRHHLEHPPRAPRAGSWFFLLMALFVASMIGLVTSLDLLQLFVLWDATAICSYFLIGFDSHDRAARRAALMALLVTGVSAVLLLLAAAIFQVRYGTSDLTRLPALVVSDPVTALACVGIVVAALAKSAQWPLHFWLPEAMAAPTPVSAYLHSAAMVAAGVFLLQRTQPVLVVVPAIGPLLVAVGWISMAAGGLLALRAAGLKQILAYSTIAQYGHVVLLIGLGGPHAAAAATFFVLAHGICKSALFLSAGTVTVATGEHELARVGGLGRQMPLLAVSTAIAAAGLAGMPLTVGFFKDEALFGAAAEHGPAMLALAVSGPALTIAYMWRFWRGVFLGTATNPLHAVAPALVWPVAILAALVLGFGVTASPLVDLARSAVTIAGDPALSVGYHFDLRPANLAALAAAVTALIVLVLLDRGGASVLRAVAAVPGPAVLYDRSLWLASRAGRTLRRWFPRPLRLRLAVVFLAALALVLLGQLSVGIQIPSLTWSAQDIPLAVALLVTVAAAVATVMCRAHLVATLTLSATTLGLAGVFALLGAPDVALVLVVINVATSLLILALLHRLPSRALAVQREARPLWRWRGEDELLAVLAGGLALLVASGTFGTPPPPDLIEDTYIDLAERAHAKNVVSAILVDFRGLDTLGEATVIVISLIAADAFMRRRRGDE